MTNQEKCKAVTLLNAMYYADSNKFDTMVEIMTASGCDFSEIANDLSAIANRINAINIHPDYGDDRCYKQMSKDTCTAKS